VRAFDLIDQRQELTRFRYCVTPLRDHTRYLTGGGTKEGNCKVEPAIPVVPMPRRALIADDDPRRGKLIASMLEELGCETLTARSATDALARTVSQR
jgi:hypothetical protein